MLTTLIFFTSVLLTFVFYRIFALKSWELFLKTHRYLSDVMLLKLLLQKIILLRKLENLPMIWMICIRNIFSPLVCSSIYSFYSSPRIHVLLIFMSLLWNWMHTVLWTLQTSHIMQRKQDRKPDTCSKATIFLKHSFGLSRFRNYEPK